MKVDCKPDTIIKVHLSAVDTWCTAVTSPASLLFRESGEQPFGVSCRARPRESMSSSGTVTVLGQWEIPDEEIRGPAQPYEGVKGTVNIAQYHKFNLMAEQAYVVVNSGEDYLLNLFIQNRGNGLDTFIIDVRNQNKLNDKGYEVILEKNMVEIPENPAEAHILIYVKTPGGIYHETYRSISIKVYSENGIEEGVPHQIFTFVIRIPGIKWLDFRCSMGFLLVGLIIIMIIVRFTKSKSEIELKNFKRKNNL